MIEKLINNIYIRYRKNMVYYRQISYQASLAAAYSENLIKISVLVYQKREKVNF